MQCTISEIARRVGVSKAAIIKARDEGRLPESLFTLNERGITCIENDDRAERVLGRTIGQRISSTMRMPRCC
jgi:hypothetical protein